MWDRIADWLTELGKTLLGWGEAILGAVLIIGAAVLIAHYVRKYTYRALSAKSFGRNGALMIGRLLSFVIITISVLIVFGNLGANWTGLLTFVGAGTVAISLSIQDVLKNFVAGIYLLLERPFRVGDKVTIRTVAGEIQGIDIRTTLVRSEEGELVLIPNAIVFAEILHNRSHYRVKRIEFTLSQLTKSVHDVEQAVADAMRDVPGVRQPIPAPQLTGSTPEGRTMVISLMVDTDPKRQAEIVERVLDALPDVKVEVTAT